jgi:acetylornithine deacetylase/succinyl-diaminopimelate desuccinylase-like protein
MPGAKSQPDADKMKNLTSLYLRSSLEAFNELLALPNDANQPATLEPNIRWMENKLQHLGFITERLPTEGLDLLLAEKTVAQASQTVLVYLQLDGQPVSPSHWEQRSPYQATIKTKDQTGTWKMMSWEELNQNIEPDWRLFARSASDAKGPIVAFLTAYKILIDEGWQHDYNLKIIIIVNIPKYRG